MMTDAFNTTSYDVIIIGAGPAGLSAALELKKAGIDRLIVLEREAEAGGIPRHCGHPPFGIHEYKQLLTGPNYARKLVRTAHQESIIIALNHTVTQLGPAGKVTVVSPGGVRELTAQRVLLATGTRETPRSARLVSGDRALGICNTGALQSMFYLKQLVPFRRPVVVGTEIVSFSALSTCRKAGIKPVAMIEENLKPTIRWPIHYVAKLFGVPLLVGTQIDKILGDKRVEAVQLKDKQGNSRLLDCDGVLFTGQFTPESTLARMSHLELDEATGSPIIDQFGRCSDPLYYSAGNLQQYYPADRTPYIPPYYTADNLPQPVDVAGRCWAEGQKTAQWIAKDLAGNL